MSEPALILASTSPFRANQLRQLGLSFEARAPNVDEDEYKADVNEPEALARALSYAKASNVALEHPNAVVVGSDQVAVIDGEILSKPLTEDRAVAQLERLSGNTHTLYTAFCLLHRDERYEHCDVTRLTMRHLTRDALARYVAADAPLQCVGSYKLESRGAALFERVETRDPTAITGLPLFTLAHALGGFGIAVP